MTRLVDGHQIISHRTSSLAHIVYCINAEILVVSTWICAGIFTCDTLVLTFCFQWLVTKFTFHLASLSIKGDKFHCFWTCCYAWLSSCKQIGTSLQTFILNIRVCRDICPKWTFFHSLIFAIGLTIVNRNVFASWFARLIYSKQIQMVWTLSVASHSSSINWCIFVMGIGKCALLDSCTSKHFHIVSIDWCGVSINTWLNTLSTFNKLCSFWTHFSTQISSI